MNVSFVGDNAEQPGHLDAHRLQTSQTRSVQAHSSAMLPWRLTTQPFAFVCPHAPRNASFFSSSLPCPPPGPPQFLMCVAPLCLFATKSPPLYTRAHSRTPTPTPIHARAHTQPRAHTHLRLRGGFVRWCPQAETARQHGSPARPPAIMSSGGSFKVCPLRASGTAPQPRSFAGCAR